jgi:YegS/Rv2252/BmrU family lipid kinase
MSEVKNVLFIVNKYAGVGYQPQVEGRILTACAKFDVECTIQFTSGPGHATDLAREGSKRNFDIVVAVGGDGTLNEVARGLLNSKTPMGIIPKGSGNGLARHLGISMKIEKALEEVLTGKVVAMDTFRLNGKLSLNVSGIGFDGHIANLFAKKKKRGFWTYARLVTLHYLTFQEFDAEFELENHAFAKHKSFMIAIANASQYGNNARVAPNASITNNSLQTAILKKVPAQRGFRFAYQMFTGKLKTGKYYTCLTMHNGLIKVGKPVAYHVDGEPCGHASEFRIEIFPHSLQMITPLKNIGKV